MKRMLRFLGWAFTAEQLKPRLRSGNVDWPVWFDGPLDGKRLVSNAWGERAPIGHYLIDAEGIIRHRGLPYNRLLEVAEQLVKDAEKK